jgi:hypothetical protein
MPVEISSVTDQFGLALRCGLNQSPELVPFETAWPWVHLGRGQRNAQVRANSQPHQRQYEKAPHRPPLVAFAPTEI